MSRSDTTIAPVEISSTVFPTADDLLLWKSLTPQERRSMLDADLDAAEASGVGTQSMDDLWAAAERIVAGSRENAL